MFTYKRTTKRWIAVIAISLVTLLGTLSLTSTASKVYGPFTPIFFKNPVGIAVDLDGYVFVADTINHRIQKFNPDGKLIRMWGGIGSDDGKFNAPKGIAIDSSNNVYVADSENNRIQKFSNTGIYIDQWGDWCDLSSGTKCKDPDGPGPLSKGDGQFFHPHGIFIDKNDNVYVVESHNHRVQKFTDAGLFLAKWGKLGTQDGQFKSPRDITIDSSGHAYVADYMNKRIQKFLVTDNGAKYELQWSPDSSIYPAGIVSDSSDFLYVTDHLHSAVKKFSSSGTPIREWGGIGISDGEFNMPNGIALSPAGTDVYVTDVKNHRIQKFTHTGDFLTKWGEFGPGVLISNERN